jgi:GxxExxY protein
MATKKYDKLPAHIEATATAIVDSAYTVHKKLGPGLLESVYLRFLILELRKRGLNVKTQVKLPIKYDGVEYDEYYILDILVDDCVIVELKAIEKIMPVHKAQILTYLKLSELRLGFLINFNDNNISDGMTRVIN